MKGQLCLTMINSGGGVLQHCIRAHVQPAEMHVMLRATRGVILLPGCKNWWLAEHVRSSALAAVAA